MYNRGFAGKSIGGTCKLTPEKFSSLKSNFKDMKIEEIEENNLSSLHDQLNTSYNKPDTPSEQKVSNKSTRISKIYANSPANKKYKNIVNYIKSHEKEIKSQSIIKIV